MVPHAVDTPAAFARAEDADPWWRALQRYSPLTATEFARLVASPRAMVLAWLLALEAQGRVFSLMPLDGEHERRWAWCAPYWVDADPPGLALFDGLDEEAP